MAYSYRDVSDVYDTLKSAGVDVGSIPELSARLNEASGTQDYSAGLSDNFIKRGSVGLDRLLEATGLPTLTGELGRAVGGLVGAPDVGESIGHGLPRGAVNWLPALAGPWGLAGVAALSGAESYTQTGSPAAGLIGAATNALMPGVAGLGERAALRAMGTRYLEGKLLNPLTGEITNVAQYFPNAAQKVGSFIGGQTTAALLGEAGQAAQAGIDPNGHYQFSPTSALLNMTLGQLPFAASHLAGKVVGREAPSMSYADMENALAASQTAIAEKVKRDAANVTPPASKLPDVTSPNDVISPRTAAETSALLAQIRADKAAKLADDHPDVRSYDALADLEMQVMRESDKTGVLGEQVTPQADRFDVTGTTHFEKPGYRIVKLDDSETNTSQGFRPGQLIGYSTKFEPGIRTVDPEAGVNAYSIPTRFHDPNVVDNEAVVQAAKPAEGTPPLPTGTGAALDQVREQSADFDRVNKQLSNVQEGDTEGLRQALEAVNGMRQKWGIEPLSDKYIAERMQKFGVTTPKDAAAGDMNSLMGRIAQKEAMMKDREAKLQSLREEVVKNPEMLEMYKATEAGRAGSFEKAMLKWDEDGRPGGIDGLRSRALKAKQQGGTGAPKVVDDTAKPAQSEAPELDHLRALRESVADTVTQGVNPDLEGDAQEFREAFADGSLSSLKDFVAQPHVQEWLADAVGEMKRLGQHVPAPKGGTVGIAERPFTPTTDHERQRIAEISPDEGGVGLLRELGRSMDPLMASLASDLAKNFPESLKRIQVAIHEMSGDGYAVPIGNRENLVVLSHALALSKDRARFEQVGMHELLHGLTLAELDNPTNAKALQELENMRQRVIEQLPTTVRDHIRQLEDSGWYQRYADGKAPWSEIKTTEGGKDVSSWSQVIYGLLNNKELVSQGFSDPDMKRLLQKLTPPPSATPKGNVFVRWVKRLLGIGEQVSDNEFAKFLDVTSNILQQGNWVSDVSNFTDRWFANKGYAPAVTRNLSRRALDVIQAGSMPLTSDALNEFLLGEDPVTKSFSKAKQALGQLYKTDSPERAAAQAVFGELKYPVDAMDNLLSAHLAGTVPNMATAMDMLPSQVTKYLYERAGDMADVLGAVKAAIDSKNKGLLNIAKPEKLRGPVEESLANLNKFLGRQDQENADRVALARLASVAPDAFFDGVLQESSQRAMAPANDDRNSLLDFVGNAIGASGGRAFQKFLEQPAQIARSNPVFGEWYAKALMLPGSIRNMAKNAMSIFGQQVNKDGTLGPTATPAEFNRMYKAVESPKTREALNQLMYLKNVRGKDAVGPVDYNDPAVQKIFAGLSAEERSNVIELDNKSRAAKVAQDQSTLRTMRDESATILARGLMRDMAMKYEPATQLAGTLFDALRSNFQDPMQAQQANAQIALVQSKTSPEAFLNLLKATQPAAQAHQLIEQQMAKNTDWVSATRRGDYLFEYMKNGKMALGSAANQAEARQTSGGREILNWRKNPRGDDDYDIGAKFSDADLQRLRDLEEHQLQALQASGASPEDLDAFKRLSVVSQIEREANQAQVDSALNLHGRTLSRGASDLPWFENHLDWIQSNSAYRQRRLLRAQGESLIQEPGTFGTPTADLIRQHMDELFQKDPEIGRKIQQLTSTWSLGFNMASQIANMTQTFMRGVTELINAGQGPLAALDNMRQTWSDYIGHKLTDKPYRTDEEQRFLKDALHDGQIDQTIFDDDAAAQANAATNFKRVLNGDKPKSIGQYLTSALGAYQTAGMWAFRHGERANHEVTLLSAFRALKNTNPDLSYDDLKKQSYLVNAAANDAGGRANRSLGLYSGKGDFARTVAMTMSSLQSYMLGSTFQLIRNLKAGLFRPEGLTPAEVYAARKAATYQLGVQLAAAGALGMPFVSGSLALLNQFFPELELNRKLRESVAGLMGTDSENGHIMTDMALSGVPSMMGWDWSSRLNAGNVLPGVSEYDGFQPEQLLGVPFSNIASFVKGAKQLAGGDPSGGYAFVPPGIRKLTQLAMSGGTLEDYKNRPLLTPTPGETLGVALGFNPKRLTDLNAANRMALQQQEQDSRRSGQQNQQLAQEALKGNFGTVRAALLSQQQANPNYDPRSAVRSIAQAAEDMTFPKDLRQDSVSPANAAARAKLLQTFSLDPTAASEVARLQFRRQIEQRLGLVDSSQAEVVTAQLMDRLRAQKPDATRSELKQAATSLLRRTHPELLATQ